jgi:Uma2 family endonuclease
MLHIKTPPLRVSRELFARLTVENPDARLERARDGTLVLMPPTGADGSRRNLNLAIQIGAWNEAARLGVAFDSSGGFELPDGSVRAADAAWVSLPRWQRLTQAQRKTFAPLCPDFVVELRSPSDRMADLREKMIDYIANGVRLGWLIDPYEKRVEAYRPDREVEELLAPESLAADDVLPGFLLKLAPIYDEL